MMDIQQKNFEELHAAYARIEELKATNDKKWDELFDKLNGPELRGRIFAENPNSDVLVKSDYERFDPDFTVKSAELRDQIIESLMGIESIPNTYSLDQHISNFCMKQTSSKKWYYLKAEHTGDIHNWAHNTGRIK
jgi:hypothetical protein